MCVTSHWHPVKAVVLEEKVFSLDFCDLNSSSIGKDIYCVNILAHTERAIAFIAEECQMFSLISGCLVGAHANCLQHGVSILSSINLREMFRQITQEQYVVQK